MTLIHDAAGAASDALFGPSGDSWVWSEHLHKASFRGVPFAVEGGEGIYGRRQAVHQYPYRDRAWIEDIGRSTRRFTLRGLLVQSSRLYSAPDVMTQRDSLIAACETGSAGTLVHPTLGELTVSVPDGGLKISDTLAGNVFPFTLTVIESGLRVFAITSSTDAASTVQTSWLSVAAQADRAMLNAGDNGEDGLYDALIILRSQTVTLLQDRGANLAPMVQARFGASLPALYLANRLYQDAGRSDDLTDMAAPVHPAFMPRTFKALSE